MCAGGLLSDKGQGHRRLRRQSWFSFCQPRKGALNGGRLNDQPRNEALVGLIFQRSVAGDIRRGAANLPLKSRLIIQAQSVARILDEEITIVMIVCAMPMHMAVTAGIVQDAALNTTAITALVQAPPGHMKG